MNRARNLVFGLTLLLIIAAAVVLLTVMPGWVLALLMALLAVWMAATPLGRQTGRVTQVGIATLPRRLGSASVVVMSIAGVVGVLVALLAMGAGFERTLKQTGTDDTALVLSAGAKSEVGSSLDIDTVAIVSQAPQVLRDARNRPLLSAERLIMAPLPKKSSGLDAFVGLRGVGERFWEIRSDVAVTAGRKFKPGLRELMTGKDAQQKFAGLEVGATLMLNNQPWTIVGVFDSGDAHNSELWGDTQAIGSSYRQDGMNSLTLRLTEAGALDALRGAIAVDPRLKVDVQTTREYYNRQSEKIAGLIGIVGATIGALMAAGAIFGALNATYTAVASRGREIATLRAVGFRGVPVIGSVLLETMLLGALGGTLGTAIAWLAFDGYVTSTAGGAGQIVFAFAVSPALLWNGLKWALVIGFIGGLFPAVRAARMPIAGGLREA